MDGNNKIYYIHGTMFSGKSLDLISTYHTYKFHGKDILVVKPSADTRDEGVIKSRMSNTTVDCDIVIKPGQCLYSEIKLNISKMQSLPSAILIDEVQFLNPSHISQLHQLSGYAPIMCYGLKTSYTGELFPSITKLLPLAENIREIKTTCSMCGSKATHNLLVRDGKPIYEGAFVNIEGKNKNDKYYAVCREHFYNPISCLL